MLNLNDDRTSDQTLVDFSAPERSRVSVAGAVLSIRVCTGKGDQIFNAAGDGSSANCLVSDVIRGSGGVPRPGRGRMLIADFPDVQAAVLAARRLQWALEGLAEYETCKEGAAAILVQSTGEASDEGLVYRTLELAQAGKILLSRSVYGYVDGLPGLTLGGSANEDWHDLSWRGGSDDASSFAADERSVLQLIRAAGHTDPGYGKSNVPASRPTPPPVKQESRESREAEAHETVIRPRFDREPPIEGSKKRPVILIAGAMVICLVGLAIYFLRPKPLEEPFIPHPPSTSTTASPPPKGLPSNTQPSGPTPPAATSTTPTPSDSGQKLPAQAGSESSGNQLPAVPVDKPASPAKGTCEVNERNVEGILSRADSLMHQGQLDQAKSYYLSVLGCSSAHARAQAGIRWVNDRKNTQQGSSGP
jgi:hypothetical protein